MALLVGAAPLVQAAESEPRLAWTECPAGARAGSAAAMRCGWLHTGDRLQGAAVALRVAILRHRPDRRDPNPIVYIPGGPGDAAGLDAAGLRRWRRWQHRAGWPHDVILFDPRGTGASRPRPHCDAALLPLRRFDAGRTTRPMGDELSTAASSAQRCRRALGAVTSARLGPRAQLADLVALLDALDVRRANLWAVSYGTRLARLFADRYPERVSAMTLDSIYPFDQNDMLALPRQIRSAIDRLVRICVHDERRCASRDPEATIAALLVRYRDAPARVRLDVGEYPSPRIEVTPYRLLLSLVFAAAAGEAAPRTVERLERAVHGEARALAPLLDRLRTRATDRDRSEAVFWSTRCAFESARVVRARWQALMDRMPLTAPYIAGAIDANVCDHWSVPPVEAPRRPPSMPSLVVIGGADAATPSAWAEAFVARWPSVRALRIDDAGHAPTLSNECAQRGAKRFWLDPRASWPANCGADPADQSGR